MRLAKTQQENKRCYQWLKNKGLNPIASTYLYTERNGEIIACCGIVTVGMIEPFASDNKIDGLELFNYACGLISGKCEVTGAFTNKEEIKSILNKRFNKWSSDNTELYIKEN